MKRFLLWIDWRFAWINVYLSGWSMDDDETYRKFVCTCYDKFNELEKYDLNERFE